MRCHPRLLLTAALCVLLPSVAGATWSIVLYDSSTGEVAIGQATCVGNLDLKFDLASLVPGKGAGAVQASGDMGSKYRKIMFKGFKGGKTAQEILAEIEAEDPGFHGRQFGIVTRTPSQATHTGAFTSDWAGGVSGQAGTLHYAIQGNLMACEKVIKKAEEAVVTTRGDLGQRLMAGMWAARKFGGDWRCSCLVEGQLQVGCGCPPDEFFKASHVGYVLVARVGDSVGICKNSTGCANGDYYMCLNVDTTAPEGPVPVLQEMHKSFRAERRGHADHLKSKAGVRGGPLRADGASQAVLEISLIDLFGNAVPFGGADVMVEHDEESAGQSVIGAVTDHGDGTYSVPLLAGTEPGTDVFRVVVEDGFGPVTLYPFPELELVDAALALGGAAGTSSDPVLILDGGAGRAGRPYAVVASAGAPSQPLGGAAAVPLAFGFLDAAGRARCTVVLPAEVAAAPGVSLAWLSLDPIDLVSNALDASALDGRSLLR